MHPRRQGGSRGEKDEGDSAPDGGRDAEGRDRAGPLRVEARRPDGERKFTRKCAAFQVLALDERLLDRPGELFRGFPLGLMEARHGACPAVLCARFRQKDWHAHPGGGVHVDAIMDRIVHGTAWVEMGEFNMRRKLEIKK